jgi:hypothetical protein
VSGRFLFHIDICKCAARPTRRKKTQSAGNICRRQPFSADEETNPLEHMTHNSKKTPVANGLAGIAGVHPGVSARLREYYQSVQEEGIPDRFLSLLERLDMAERQAGEGQRIKDTTR